MQLPIFPLNTVLFPYNNIQLHIFEERYRIMLDDISNYDQSFGVVLIKHGLESGGPVAKPHSVGCIATVQNLQTLEDGRSNITIMGQEKFLIHELLDEKPYLTAYVDIIENQFNYDHKDTDNIQRLIKDYLGMVLQLPEEKIENIHFPGEEDKLLYLAVTMLQINNSLKQDLLEINSLAALSIRVQELYSQKIQLIGLSKYKNQFGPFGSN